MKLFKTTRDMHTSCLLVTIQTWSSANTESRSSDVLNLKKSYVINLGTRILTQCANDHATGNQMLVYADTTPLSSQFYCSRVVMGTVACENCVEQDWLLIRVEARKGRNKTRDFA